MNGKKYAQWLILHFLMAAVAPAWAGQAMHIAYPEFAPFHFSDGNGAVKGFFHDILEEALAERRGLKLVWHSYPWARCQEKLKYGEVDAIITVPTPERARYSRTHNRPFYSKSLNVFTFAGNPQVNEIKKITTIDDIKTGGFSVITYSGNGWHRKNVSSRGIRTYETGILENVWQMLAHGRGDLVIEWPAAAVPMLRKLGISHQVLDTGIGVAEMHFHLLISAESEWVHILNEFDLLIEKMKKDGTFSEILAGYF